MAYLWFGMIVLFIVLEAVTTQLVSIWFAVGAAASVISLGLGASIVVQLAVFVVISALFLVAVRPYLKKYTKVKHEPTNSDRYVGREGIVVEKIDNGKAVGKVRVMGNVWTARSVDGNEIPEGEKVSVDSISGVKLMVRK